MDNFGLIVGAMKSGTSSLWRHLGQHPEVCLSDEKEPNFFADDAHWAAGLPWYRARFSRWDPTRHRIAVEASTHYTKVPGFPNAAERVARLLASPEGRGLRFRFVYLMREPIARIESHLAHGRDAGWDVAQQSVEGGVHPQVLAVGRYATQIGEYARRFPRQDILLADFAELQEEPAALMRRVCRFLGIDPEFRFAGLDEVHNRGEDRAKTGTLLHRAKRLLGGEGARPAALTPEQRAYVYREIGPDLRRLSELGFDVARWHLPPEGADARASGGHG